MCVQLYAHSRVYTQLCTHMCTNSYGRVRMYEYGCTVLQLYLVYGCIDSVYSCIMYANFETLKLLTQYRGGAPEGGN